MSDVVIKVENLSKQYRLGHVGTGTLKDDFKRWRYKLMGKEDPFLTVGDINDRTQKTKGDYVWALKDINFEVKRGEVIGIIGKNGAGKSTLLKILSRTTGPTTGTLKMKGRVASLLEVGTGFHGELSGRENIFLNGALMGMSKAEIRNKFDEIVDFAGVEKYIDTPVKRYSSGMYVRLAFGVAAHLEPDILIVDEVLAVGDAEFQKKALGKIKDVARGGDRTVIFVSHNMGAIKTLCKTGLMLKQGRMIAQDSIENIVDKYLVDNVSIVSNSKKVFTSKCKRFDLLPPYLSNCSDKSCNAFAFQENIRLNFQFFFHEQVEKINPGFAVLNSFGDRIFTSHLKDDNEFKTNSLLIGSVKISTDFNLLSLAPGSYSIIFGVRDEYESTVIYSEEDLTFSIDQTHAKNIGQGVLWHTSAWKLN